MTDKNRAAIPAEAILSSLLEASEEGVVVFDLEHRICLANKTASTLLQGDDLDSPQRRRLFKYLLERGARGGRNWRQLTWTDPNSGSSKSLCTRTFSVGAAGKRLGTIVVLRPSPCPNDVQASRSVLRHEVLAPLTSLGGFAEILLEREMSEEERRRYLKIVREEAQRLAGLIEAWFSG